MPFLFVEATLDVGDRLIPIVLHIEPPRHQHEPFHLVGLADGTPLNLHPSWTFTFHEGDVLDWVAEELRRGHLT